MVPLWTYLVENFTSLFFCCFKCTLLNMKQENHETRTFSQVSNICKPCLRLNVPFFYESSVLLAVVANNLGTEWKDGDDRFSARWKEWSLCKDELPETLKIILFTMHVESFYWNITQLCNRSMQCTVYTNALVTDAFSASVKNSLLFFFWIWKSELMPETPLTAAYSPLLKTRPPKMSHNALDRQMKHLDPVSHATPKWRISAFTYKSSSSLMGPYHSCKPKQKKTNKQK